MDPSALFACDPKILSPWEWDKCWCAWRLYVLFPASAVVLWLLCMNVGFLRVSLPPEGKPRLWPREAFWRWVGWWLFLSTAIFVAIFAGLSDELRPRGPWRGFLSSASWLAYMTPLLILAGGLLAMLLCRLIGFYSRPRRPRPAASVAQP